MTLLSITRARIETVGLIYVYEQFHWYFNRDKSTYQWLDCGSLRVWSWRGVALLNRNRGTRTTSRWTRSLVDDNLKTGSRIA